MVKTSNLIRIGVMGAPSTGKTQLTDRIEKTLRSRDIPVERTRYLGHRDARVPLPLRQTDHTVETSTWVMATGIAIEVLAAARLDGKDKRVVLADQACWEALACFRAAQEWHGRTATRTDREALHRLASAHTPYTLLLATHLDPGLPTRRRNNYDSRYRSLVDRHIHTLLGEEGLPYVHVTSDERAQKLAIERALQLCLAQTPV
ncbi:AAA family ATPase [Streptomyces rimosus]|uniref:AAA family ATPase n=1 Tax=Streptomyces rimosus TaxID=1927 RepID=UPI0004BE7402|nr:AAA family ATPase [Streptomyces rimosus]